MTHKEVPHVSQLLAGLPCNWGKWGSEDEVGALNYLGRAEVLGGISAVRSGKTFTLQIPIGRPEGDPVWPGRRQAHRVNVLDRGHYLCGKGPEHPGHAEYVECRRAGCGSP